MMVSRASLAFLVSMVTVGSTDAFVGSSNAFGSRAATSSSLSSAATSDVKASNKSAFLTQELANKCVEVAGGTPAYVYSLAELESRANDCLAFPNAFGLTVRYAMKACPNAALLQYFHSRGIHLDASSGYEVRRAMAAGVPADHISLSTQEFPPDFAELVDMGVNVNCCSISQLEAFGKHYAGTGKTVGVRINPGVGSGGFSKSTTSFSKTNVGGPSSSFGIWHTLVETEVVDLVKKYGLTVERVHTHIGSGSDPGIWQQVATQSLQFCKLWDTVTALNLGGGYKVGRNEWEASTDLQQIGGPVADAFRTFAEETGGRQLRLEIEPGTYLVAMAGALVATVQDKVQTTGEGSHVFLKLNAGMTDVLRPSLYGAIHPLTILNDATETESVVVVGHCCESGDLMTPNEGEPESLGEREMNKASIGDLLVMDGSGAYCSGMSTKNYNSFPETPEVLVDLDGNIHLIRKRQSLDQIFQNEQYVPTGLF
mmetsp:Transcript_23187/g.41885  ORF Transcript_23187/g.41885 Transcript_23187/m.41885 type:complete len:484 (-) Transcript_23187:97-1548(-)